MTQMSASLCASQAEFDTRFISFNLSWKWVKHKLVKFVTNQARPQALYQLKLYNLQRVVLELNI